ncbi:DHC3A-like protein [Mya arenaria]|uniref:DHC3A-like protein n=1 Tax=Mya arenaria TaxID=6604 RepID=A0ABY7ESU2_MYAAR|nr:DHC3A-like protein [Mya arenaria]
MLPPQQTPQKPRKPVEDSVVTVDCGPFLRRFGLHRCIPRESSQVWFVKDICGIICVVITWMLILYAEYVVMFIMLWPSPSRGYFWGNAILFNAFTFLAIASHSKAMLTDPGAVPKGNATRENILKLGLKEGQVLYICLISIHAVYMSIQHFITCIGKDWKGCSGVSPPATTIFLIFLVFEGLLFGIFTAIMCGSQMTAICSDETGIESLKKDQATWERRSYWLSVKAVGNGNR